MKHAIGIFGIILVFHVISLTESHNLNNLKQRPVFTPKTIAAAAQLVVPRNISLTTSSYIILIFLKHKLFFYLFYFPLKLYLLQKQLLIKMQSLLFIQFWKIMNIFVSIQRLAMFMFTAHFTTKSVQNLFKTII